MSGSPSIDAAGLGPSKFADAPFARANRLSRERAQRHSRTIRYLRLIVPAVAAALLLTYALSATPPQIDPKFLDNFSNIDVETSPMTLDRPRYAGEDLDGMPFEVAAKSATRVSDSTTIVDLENPEAFRTIDTDGSGESVGVTAKAGRLNTEAKLIDLERDVRLEHSLGGAPIIFNTEAAAVDLNANTVTSKSRVTGEGDTGALSADSVTVFQGEGRAVLEGNVKFRIEPKKETGESGLR